VKQDNDLHSSKVPTNIRAAATKILHLKSLEKFNLKNNQLTMVSKKTP